MLAHGGVSLGPRFYQSVSTTCPDSSRFTFWRDRQPIGVRDDGPDERLSPGAARRRDQGEGTHPDDAQRERTP